MGVEEEFLLLDADTLQPASRGAAVLKRARDALADTGGPGTVSSEFWQSEVEAATGVCTTLSQLREHLAAGRSCLARAAAAEHARLASVPLPVTPGPAPRTTEGELYAAFQYRWQATATDSEYCGAHVHIGVPDRELAVAVLNHLTAWLPSLLAVTANSPYHHGRDTGFGSWRLVTYTRLPCAGLPPWYSSLAHYDAEQARMADAGLWVEGRGGLRLARLSAHLPTVEIRIADACATIDDTLLYAALARGLVHTALTQLQQGRTAPRLDPATCDAALWTAARHGLAKAVDPRDGRVLTGQHMLAALVRHITPALDQLGDSSAVQALLRRLTALGSGADRQRHASSRTAQGALASVLRQTMDSVP